jgi:hypothetical protein
MQKTRMSNHENIIVIAPNERMLSAKQDKNEPALVERRSGGSNEPICFLRGERYR